MKIEEIYILRYFSTFFFFFPEQESKILQTIKKNVIVESKIVKLFSTFKIGNFNLVNRKCSGRAIAIDDGQIEMLFIFVFFKI